MRANLPQEIPHLPRETWHLLQEMRSFPTGDVSSPPGDTASPNCGICDTAVRFIEKQGFYIKPKVIYWRFQVRNVWRLERVFNCKLSE